MQRRMFVKLAAISAAALAGAPRAGLAQGARSAAPRLDPADPLAVTLGYVENASKVDRKKFAQFRPEQKCSNCQLYLGDGGWAPCTIFQGKQVAGAGWCSAWVKKV